MGCRRSILAKRVAAVGFLLTASSCSEDRALGPSLPGAESGSVHPAGIADPKSTAFHGTFLRAERWAPMLDPTHPGACGQCHDGTPARPAGVTFAATGAPACTTCHTEPQGVLACSTCHAAGSTLPGAHAAHIAPSAARATGLACSSCHPIPGAKVIGGLHGNGSVDVVFDPAVVTPEASYDATRGACAVSCHDQGGARAQPIWTDTTAMRCGDCHGAPPAAHFPGPCTTCHREADGTGTSLTPGPLHMNGRVDLGNGNGTCSACHGSGSDPWPTTGAHPTHETPTLTLGVDCATCHSVPKTLLAPGHLDGVVQIAFSGRAIARGARPIWDQKSCEAVACHGAGLIDTPAVVPVWSDTSGQAKTCGACHGIPPTQHTPSTSCGQSNCHGSEVAPAVGTGIPLITASGLGLHINGMISP